MHRTSSSIRRYTLTAALGMLLVVLAGCGTNPVAPGVSDSIQSLASAEKHPNHANGRERNSPNYQSASTGSGAGAGSMSDPGGGELAETLVTE